MFVPPLNGILKALPRPRQNMTCRRDQISRNTPPCQPSSHERSRKSKGPSGFFTLCQFFCLLWHRFAALPRASPIGLAGRTSTRGIHAQVGRRDPSWRLVPVHRWALPESCRRSIFPDGEIHLATKQTGLYRGDLDACTAVSDRQNAVFSVLRALGYLAFRARDFPLMVRILPHEKVDLALSRTARFSASKAMASCGQACGRGCSMDERHEVL